MGEFRATWVLWALGLLVATAPPGRGEADDDHRAAPSVVLTGEDLNKERERLQRTRDLPQNARAPLEMAARALAEAQRRHQAGDEGGARRLTQLARAALALADRRLMLAREAAELRAARARREDARQAVRRAAEALEAERARLQALEATK